MINLLKKDLIACFKADIKTIVKLIVGILIFSFILFPIASIMIPLFISYIFILRSFYLDELNKCDYFERLSFPSNMYAIRVKLYI